jgi:hypothetical protein
MEFYDLKQFAVMQTKMCHRARSGDPALLLATVKAAIPLSFNIAPDTPVEAHLAKVARAAEDFSKARTTDVQACGPELERLCSALDELEPAVRPGDDLRVRPVIEASSARLTGSAR